jgi:hypothetical protein
MVGVFIKGYRKALTESGEEIIETTEFRLFGVSAAVSKTILDQTEFNDQLSTYLSYVDSVNTGVDFSHYVETFCEGEEEDLIELYSGKGRYSAAIIDDFYVANIVRRGDPLFEELARSAPISIDNEKPYSFLKVAEKPYKDTVMGNLKGMVDKGYNVEFVIDRL